MSFHSRLLPYPLCLFPYYNQTQPYPSQPSGYKVSHIVMHFPVTKSYDKKNESRRGSPERESSSRSSVISFSETLRMGFLFFRMEEDSSNSLWPFYFGNYQTHWLTCSPPPPLIHWISFHSFQSLQLDLNNILPHFKSHSCNRLCCLSGGLSHFSINNDFAVTPSSGFEG